MSEVEKLAEISARISHNHPEGVAGAKAVAGSIFLLRSGKSKYNLLDVNGLLRKGIENSPFTLRSYQKGLKHLSIKIERSVFCLTLPREIETYWA